VRSRGVDFPLTAENETLLRNEGATDELIKAIRQYSPKLKPMNNSSGAAKAGTVRKNSIGMEFVYIPSGEFMMGSSDAEIDEVWYECKKYSSECKREYFTMESPKHKVTIKDGFWIGKYEVTQAEWQTVMGDNPSYFKDCGGNCPVEQVSWDDIQVFLKRLNTKDTQFEYRLPTEAEWEYAARAGTTGDYAGNLDAMAWYWENSGDYRLSGEWNYEKWKAANGRTHPVGGKQANAWGLYDMHGNVWEWCQDWYSESYYASSPGVNPTGAASGSNRVGRGGGWFNGAVFLRSAYRFYNSPATRLLSLGFRVVRN